MKTLEHPNGWHRDTAARLLYERQDEAAVGALTALAITEGRNKSGPARNPACRIHALHALAGLKKLEEEHIALALSSRSSEVRERALMLGEPFLALLNSHVWQKMRVWAASSVTNLPITRADMQLAFAFGQLTKKAKFEPFCRLTDRFLGDGTFPRDIPPRYIGNGFSIGYTNLFSLITSAAETPEIQRAALASLSHSDRLEVGPDLLKRWWALSPSLRAEAVDVLLKRGDHIRALLDAMEKGVIKPSEINAAQRSFLLSHRIVAFRQRAEKASGACSRCGTAICGGRVSSGVEAERHGS